MIARRPRHAAREFRRALGNATVFAISFLVLAGCLAVFLWIVVAAVIVVAGWVDQ